jgi:UDP-N-acetylmuramyl pentapeptide synthase
MSLVEKLDVDGVCFLNKDNAYIREYAIQNTCKKVWFSMLTEADYQVVNMYQTSEITQFTVLVDGMYYEFKWNGDKNEGYLDAYKKWENVVIKDEVGENEK